MERKPRQGFALGPSRSRGHSPDVRRPWSGHSAPPSPVLTSQRQHSAPPRGILRPPMQYGSASTAQSPPQPRKNVSFGHRKGASFGDASAAVQKNGNDYIKADWSLLGVERRNAQSKYLFTLLHFPAMTLYTWPLDSKAPSTTGGCYITSLRPHAPPTPELVRVSLSVLEEAVLAWTRYVRSTPSLRTSVLFAEEADIAALCSVLGLQVVPEAQRLMWLNSQQVPDTLSSLPPSRNGSPASSTHGTPVSSPLALPAKGTPTN